MSAESEKELLAILDDIGAVSEACSTRTFVWAGLVPDILQGRFLREHRDVDGFTLNLLEKRDALSEAYRVRGYAITFLDEFGMLRIDRNGMHAAFNRLEIRRRIAMWRHIGDRGTVYFPANWLPTTPNIIHGIKVYTSGLRFEYCIKKEPSLLSPVWKRREKDAEALAWLHEKLIEEGTDPDALFRDIWSENRFWAERGYAEYAGPYRIGSAANGCDGSRKGTDA